jgi:hypothetical protein
LTLGQRYRSFRKRFTTFLVAWAKRIDISKTFVVPSIADKIVVDFDYYSIDGHSDGDQCSLESKVLTWTLTCTPAARGTTTVLYNDIKVTIVERGTSNIGFSSEMDEKSIPRPINMSQNAEIGFASK